MDISIHRHTLVNTDMNMGVVAMGMMMSSSSSSSIGMVRLIMMSSIVVMMSDIEVNGDDCGAIQTET